MESISALAFTMKLRGGTCTTAKYDKPKSVTHRALYILHEGFGNYDVFMNNCEDFALYCKTGFLICGPEARGRSGQVYSVLIASLGVVLTSPFRLFMASPVDMTTAGVSCYCFSRCATDVGVQGDVMKVEIEDVVSFCGFKRKSACSRDQTDLAVPKRQIFS